MEKCLLHQALRLGDPLIKLLELRFVSSSSETSRSSGTIQTSQSSISSHPAFPDEEATTGEEGTQDKEATAPDMLPASSEPALELTIHAGGLVATTTTLFNTGDPWGTSISQPADRLQMDRPFMLHLAHTDFL